MASKLTAIQYQAEITYQNEYLDTKKNPPPGETLLKTLDYCFEAGIDVPAWAKAAYRKCYAKYGNRIGDDPLVFAFDTDQEAGKQKESKLRKQKHLNAVCHTLWHLHINEKMPMDGNLFEEVANRLDVKGIGASTIKKWWYEKEAVLVGLVIIPDCVLPKK
jgi:hypothetical protein